MSKISSIASFIFRAYPTLGLLRERMVFVRTNEFTERIKGSNICFYQVKFKRNVALAKRHSDSNARK